MRSKVAKFLRKEARKNGTSYKDLKRKYAKTSAAEIEAEVKAIRGVKYPLDSKSQIINLKDLKK